MNAIPARKNNRPTTSPAAATFSTKPVIEIAFGVSRDSISRSRISSCVVGPERGGRTRRGRGVRTRFGASWVMASGGEGSLRLRLRLRPERPCRRPSAGQQARGQERRQARRDRAEEDVGQIVVCRGDNHER